MNWLARAAEVRHAADAVMASLAQRIDELSAPDVPGVRFARAKGFAGAADLVASVAALARSDAGKLVGVGRALVDPHASHREAIGPLAQALRDGKISAEKANLIRRCLEEVPVPDPLLEGHLVDAASRMDVSGLKDRCVREVAWRGAHALEEREARQWANRSLRFFNEPDGMVTLHGKLDPVTAAPVRAILDAEVRRMLSDQRDLPTHERPTPAQAAADALAGLARHAMGCEDPAAGVKTTVVVRVSKADLETGLGLAECDGLAAPISVASLRRLAVDAEILPMVMGGSSLPLEVGRAQRLFSRTQRMAIAERDAGCAKCGAPVARCDVHHIRWWSQGGGTDIANGVLLCVGCHHRVHEFGWEINVEDGEVWFIPPAAVDPNRAPRSSYRNRVKPQGLAPPDTPRSEGLALAG